MVDETSKLQVEVDGAKAAADIGRITTAFNKLEAQVARTAAGFKRLGGASVRMFSKMKSAGSVAFRALGSGLRIVQKLGRTFVNVFRNVLKVILAAGAAFALFARSVTQTGNEINKFINTLVILKGNVADAKTELGFLFDLSNKLGTSFTAAATPFTKFAAAASGTISDESIRDVFEAFATVGVALQLTKSEVTGVFLALQQIASKGVVSMEELRLQLAERVPGAMRLAASSMNMTMADFEEAVRDRTINAGEFLERFSAKLKDTFGIAADLASKRLFADIQRLGNALTAFKLNVFVAGFEEGLRTLIRSATGFLNNNPELASALGNFSKSIFDNVANFLNSLSADRVISILNTLIGAFESLINALQSLAFFFQRAFGSDFKPILSDITNTSKLINKMIDARALLDADISTGQRVEERFGGLVPDKITIFSDSELVDKQLELNAMTVSIQLMRGELEGARERAKELGLELSDLPESAFEILGQGTFSSIRSAKIKLDRIQPIEGGVGGKLNLSGQPLGVPKLPPAVFAALDDADSLARKMPEFFAALLSGEIRSGMTDLQMINFDLLEVLKIQNQAYQEIIDRQTELNRIRDLPDELVQAEVLNKLIREQSKATEDFLKLEEKKFQLLKDQNDELERRNDILAKAKTFQKSLEETFTSVQDVIFNSIKKVEDSIVDLVVTGKANFKDLADSIIRELVRMAIQAFITRFILGPLLSGFTQSVGESLGGTFEQPPAVTDFVGHTGGIIGSDRLEQRSGFDRMRRDESSIIVQKGEGIFTQEQMRALAPIAELGSLTRSSNPPPLNIRPIVKVEQGVRIEIINNDSSNNEITTERDVGPDGTELIRVIITAVATDIANDGKLSQVMKGKFGLRNTTGLR